MLIGRGLDRLLGTATFWIAIIALVGTGAWMLWERDEDGESAERVAHAMAGPAIWLAGLAVSVDEFAVGLSAGLLRAPLEITIALIAVQAAVASWLGWTLGAHLRRSAGEWGEKAAGTVLIVLALFLAAARFWQLQQ
jgi:putative Mn2+ efflux pump MntP